jgi:hypothetical protein
MRKLIFIIPVLSLFILNSCKETEKIIFQGQKCEVKDTVKWSYINKYAEFNRAIKVNWTQYFKYDIYAELKHMDRMIFPIHLDSYGSVYPDLVLLNNVRSRSFRYKRLPDKYTGKYSLYQFFKGANFREKLQDALVKLPPERRVFYDTVLSQYSRLKTQDKLDIERFYTIWDSARYDMVVADLKKRIDSTGATKILFYVHGYNVPYSLAALQSIELKKFINSSAYSNKQKLLLVPVFWPSNNLKYCNLTEKGKFKGFSVSDKTKLFRGGLRNGKLFWYYANQAYYAATGLRQILNGLNGAKTKEGKDVEIVLYSHSLGAVVVTSAIMNTFSKMQLNNFVYRYMNVNWDSIKRVDGDLYRKLKRSDELGFEIASQFKKVNLPKQKMTIYLSAPAISGENTFVNIDSAVLKNINVFSTVNKSDPVLSKKNASFLGRVGLVNAGNFGATSFGCDSNDCRSVKEFFASRVDTSKLRYQPLNVDDHDFFVYLNTPGYKSFITEMLNTRPSSETVRIKKMEFNVLFKKLCTLTSSSKFRSVSENRYNHRTKLVPLKNIEVYAGTQMALGFLVKNLVDDEKRNEFSESVLPETREKIVTKNNPFALVMLRRELIEELDPQKSEFMKRKLINLVDRQITETCYQMFPMYSYKTRHEQLIKFVSIRSGNDLFTPAGLYATLTSTEIKNSAWYFQRNDDRDYTGSLLIEVGTDYLRAPRRRNLNTYQTVLYGFDVFTPYFRDYAIFTKNDTFNINDRPHASFQYFGWSKNGLSKRDIYRWSFVIKIGKIGGFNGRDFQAALHQDVSFSPRPRGWGAQIANNGRLGVSFEGSHEWDFELSELSREQHFWNMRWQLLTNWKFGTYMTNAGVGMQITNKSFRLNNSNFINHRPRQNVIRWSDHLMYSLSFMATGVKHNTMLQGYGIFDTNETKDDSLTPKSRHVMTRNNVRPLVFNTAFTLSYTAPYFTIFYRWTSYSPETWIHDTGAKRPGETQTMNIGDRWHHFAVIGMTFNVRKY